MSALKPYGTFPTPYGISVPVYYPDGVTSGEPDHFLFDMDGTAIFAGIHDKDERNRFIADAKRSGHALDFKDYGGHVIPKASLAKPREPAYPRLTGMGLDMPIEAWITGTLDHYRWCDRADFLLGLIGYNQKQAAADCGYVAREIYEEFYPIALSVVLTASLEHLCEADIDCIEAAALYTLTEHKEWHDAGIAWLRPFRDTWFRDWVAVRPEYKRFARSLQVSMNLPDWLAGPGDAT